MTVVFETPGELDIRAFTILGMHAKPNSKNPIGRFGTGLKNAIAVLVREGLKVQVFIGETEYEFYKSSAKFRDQDFEQIRMRRRQGFMSKWRYDELPYTTSFARFWQLWQAFRELHSNTLDEGGETWLLDKVDPSPRPGKTHIIVTGDAFDQVYHERDKIFLPSALTQREGSEDVQVFSAPSNHLYWRGMRVFDLEKPSIYTYNILRDVELTEDRTLKYIWSAQSAIAEHTVRSKDTKLINSIVSAEKDKFFEGRLDFDFAVASPSNEFKEVMAKKKARGSYVSLSSLSYYSRYAPSPPAVTLTLQERLEKWAYETSLPEDLQDLLKHLLRCEIKEPLPPVEAAPDDNEIPF